MRWVERIPKCLPASQNFVYKTSFTKTFRFPGLEFSITVPILSWELQTESTMTWEHSKANNQRLTPTVHTLKQSHTHPHTTVPLFAQLHSRILLTTVISDIPTAAAHAPAPEIWTGTKQCMSCASSGNSLSHSWSSYYSRLITSLSPTLRTLPKNPFKKALIKSSPDFSK